MNAPTKLATFAVALAATLGVGYAAGSAAGPVDEDDDVPAQGPPTTTDHGDMDTT